MLRADHRIVVAALGRGRAHVEDGIIGPSPPWSPGTGYPSLVSSLRTGAGAAIPLATSTSGARYAERLLARRERRLLRLPLGPRLAADAEDPWMHRYSDAGRRPRTLATRPSRLRLVDEVRKDPALRRLPGAGDDHHAGPGSPDRYAGPDLHPGLSPDRPRFREKKEAWPGLGGPGLSKAPRHQTPLDGRRGDLVDRRDKSLHSHPITGARRFRPTPSPPPRNSLPPPRSPPPRFDVPSRFSASLSVSPLRHLPRVGPPFKDFSPSFTLPQSPPQPTQASLPRPTSGPVLLLPFLDSEPSQAQTQGRFQSPSGIRLLTDPRLMKVLVGEH